jgi:hypothetical protein
MAFYHVDVDRSVYYEGNDLIIRLLFASQEDCRRFVEELHALRYRFSLPTPPAIIGEMRPVVVDYQPLPLHSYHYDTTRCDSPPHRLCASDYDLQRAASRSREVKEIGLFPCRMTDPHARLQMIEDPDNPFVRGLPIYRRHLVTDEAPASNKRRKTMNVGRSILHMSGPMHQRFDGLNIVGDTRYMVPSIAFKFIQSEPEIVEVVRGYPWPKHKVTLSIEANSNNSNNVELLDSVGSTLKQGSSFDAHRGVWMTFVHVDSVSEFQTFLEIRYRITKQLWSENIPVGEDVENDAMEELERKASWEVANGGDP